MSHRLVKDWMTANPITILPKTTLPDAHKLMKESKIRRLPVVDRGELIGIVTLGDVREAQPSNATTLSATNDLIWVLLGVLNRLRKSGWVATLTRPFSLCQQKHAARLWRKRA